jgi:hypothetical protein
MRRCTTCRANLPNARRALFQVVRIGFAAGLHERCRGAVVYVLLTIPTANIRPDLIHSSRVSQAREELDALAEALADDPLPAANLATIRCRRAGMRGAPTPRDRDGQGAGAKRCKKGRPRLQAPLLRANSLRCRRGRAHCDQHQIRFEHPSSPRHQPPAGDVRSVGMAGGGAELSRRQGRWRPIFSRSSARRRDCGTNAIYAAYGGHGGHGR